MVVVINVVDRLFLESQGAFFLVKVYQVAVFAALADVSFPLPIIERLKSHFHRQKDSLLTRVDSVQWLVVLVLLLVVGLFHSLDIGQLID